MKSLHIRLTLITLVAMVVGVVGTAAIIQYTRKDVQLKKMERDIITQLKLVRYLASFERMPYVNNTKIVNDYKQRAQMLKKIMCLNVTFVSEDGTIISDRNESTINTNNSSIPSELLCLSSDQSPQAVVKYNPLTKTNVLYIAMVVNTPQKNVSERRQSNCKIYMCVSTNVQHLYRDSYDKRIIVCLVSSVFIAIICFVIYRVVQGIATSLEHITKVAYRIATLNYEHRVYLNRNDQIGRLGHAINCMADSLQMQLKTIRENESLLQSVLQNMTSGIFMINDEHNIVLINREAERMLGVPASRVINKKYAVLKHHVELVHMIERCLKAREHTQAEVVLFGLEDKQVQIDGVIMFGQKKNYRGILFLLQDVTAIRRLESMRSEFVCNVSHEFKTPLAAVKGFAETLLNGEIQDEETVKLFLQIICDEGERLNRLSGNILELSQIESKLVPLNCSAIEVEPFLCNIVRTLHNLSQKKQVYIQVQAFPNLWMEADEDKLKQIFLNLISNGIDYTSEGGYVTIQVTVLEHNCKEYVQFLIIDNGIGISSEHLAHIFERFYRVDNRSSRVSGGTGLGLYIVRHLVDLHGGTVFVQSKLGVGTTFTVQLPVIQTTDNEIDKEIVYEFSANGN